MQTEGPAQRRVILFEVEPGQMNEFVKRQSQAMAIRKRLGVPASRIFQATLAGPNTNTVTIVIEHPSLAAFAANNAKLYADSEFQSWLEELLKAGIGRLVSDSLLAELTP